MPMAIAVADPVLVGGQQRWTRWWWRRGKGGTGQWRGNYKTTRRQQGCKGNDWLWRHRWQGQVGNRQEDNKLITNQTLALTCFPHFRMTLKWPVQRMRWPFRSDANKLDPIWVYFCISSHNLIINSYMEIHIVHVGQKWLALSCKCILVQQKGDQH